MTKYSIDVFDGNKWKPVALMADTADFEAMTDFCVRQFDNGNSMTTPAENIAIIEIETGEVLWDYAHNFAPDDCEPDDWDAEMGFNPYEGCYDYDC